MANALVPIDATKYGALVDTSGLAAAARSLEIPGLELGEKDLPQIRVPAGGGTNWTVNPDDDEPELVKDLRAVIITMECRGFLWPEEEPSDHRPVLITHNLQEAYQVGDWLGDLDEEVLARMAVVDENNFLLHFDWRPPSEGGENIYAEWNSSSRGGGKRVKELLRLLLLLPGEVIPQVLMVPPTSVAKFKPFKVACMRKKVPVHLAEVSLTLERADSATGQPYSKIVPKLVGRVPEDYVPAVNALREQFRSPDPRSEAAVAEAMRQANEGPSDFRAEFVGDDPLGE